MSTAADIIHWQCNTTMLWTDRHRWDSCTFWLLTINMLFWTSIQMQHLKTYVYNTDSHSQVKFSESWNTTCPTWTPTLTYSYWNAWLSYYSENGKL